MILRRGIYGQKDPSTPVVKNALHFDSVYKDRVTLPLNFVTGARTISTWVKLDTTTFNGQTRNFIFGQYGSSGKRTTYFEFRDTGVLRWYVSTTTSGNTGVLIESDAGVYFNANQWYYLTVTIESSTNTAKMYVDGVQQTATASSTVPLSRSGAVFCWGSFGPYLPTFAFDGTLKELNVWTVERSQAEITADMTRTWTGSESGLKAYFPTTEGSGVTIQDINTSYSGTITTTNGGGTTYIDSTMWVIS